MSLLPLYQACEEFVVIMVHPWDMMGKETMKDYWLPWLVGMPAETSRAICSMIFGGIFEKFPKLCSLRSRWRIVRYIPWDESSMVSTLDLTFVR